MTSKCYICKRIEDVRPYGKGGRSICFKCMKATPEREREAERQFGARLQQAGRIAVLTEKGPRPATPSEQRLAKNALGDIE